MATWKAICEEQNDDESAENYRDKQDPQFMVTIHISHFLQQEGDAAEKYEIVNGIEARKHVVVTSAN